MEITWVTVLVFAGALGLVYGLGRILLWPARKLGKLLLNGILGGLVLFAINALGGLFGLKVGPILELSNFYILQKHIRL